MLLSVVLLGTIHGHFTIRQAAFCPCICSNRKEDICKGSPSVCRMVRCNPRSNGLACCDGVTTPLPEIANPLTAGKVKSNIDEIPELSADAARLAPEMTREVADILFTCSQEIENLGGSSELSRVTLNRFSVRPSNPQAKKIFALFKLALRGTLEYIYSRLTNYL